MRMIESDFTWANVGVAVTGAITFIVGYTRLGSRMGEVERREVEAIKDRAAIKSDVVTIKEDVAFMRGVMTKDDT